MVIVVDLAGQPPFFIRAAIDLDISEVVGLVINGAILIKMDVIIGFIKLSL